MKTITKLVLLITTISISCNSETEKWEYLFDGTNLDQWETYLGPEFNTGINQFDSIPIGLNNDPSEIFSLVKIQNENVLRISGESFGIIFTKRDFENYHLQLEFQWGELKWPPRKNQKRDSGILYHGNGSQAADGKFWMRSQEFQVQEGDCGDYWGVAGGIMDIKANKDSADKYIYNASAELKSFGFDSPYDRMCQKSHNAEKPNGEWNTLDLYCFGNTSVHVVNGEVVMMLENSRQFVNGSIMPLTSGKIQLQSEGAEIFYKNIKIKKIEELPRL